MIVVSGVRRSWDIARMRLAFMVSFSAFSSIRSFSWSCTFCLVIMMHILLARQEISIMPTNVIGYPDMVKFRVMYG